MKNEQVPRLPSSQASLSPQETFSLLLFFANKELYVMDQVARTHTSHLSKKKKIKNIFKGYY